jgi:hypothetical protein
MAVDGYLHIAEPAAAVTLGAPSSSGSTYVNTSNQYDCAIAGLPFFLGPSKEYPYKRETAQYRKQQIDQQKEPGEQTLTGWWLRSQSSFHYGAGIRYEEPVQGPEVGMRYNKSAGVDVFNIGKVTLLPDVTKNTDITVSSGVTPLVVGGTDSNGINVVFTASNSTLYRTTEAGVTSTVTWGGSGAILALAQDGVNYYAANATGIYKGTLAGGSGSLVFTHPSSVGTVTNVSMGWVKQRLIAGVNNYIFEITPITSFSITAGQLANNIATLKTDTVVHNFSVGSQVTIASVSASYNGVFSVTAVPSATEFSYYHNHADDQYSNTLSGTAVLTTNNNLPIYAHPNAAWKWTGICEGPNAIYVSGYAGDSSTVYRLSLDTNGAVPLLNKAVTAADMPKGEIIYALGSYIGKYMVFGTNKGIRVGTIDTSGFVSSGYITYGPLTVITNGYEPASDSILNGAPCKAITFNDRYAYCTVTNYIDTDGSETTFNSGLIKIDLSREIAPNQMAYATHLQVPSTAEASSVCILGSTNKLVIGIKGVGVHFQAATLISSGYLQTGQIRYFTLEDKHFELVKLRETLPMVGTLKLSVVNSDNTVVDIITVDNTFDFTQDIVGMDTQDIYPKESLALRFTFNSATTQAVGTEDSFNGYQLKALPAVKRQRIITLPLLCYDFEGDRYNMTTGYEGGASERIQALETIESGGDVVVLQDFTNDETVRGVIESITFIRMTPPERRFKGFGGMIMCQFRTI